MKRSRTLRKGGDCADIWRDREAAVRYDASVRKNGRAQALATLRLMDLSGARNVLDIGAGPGTYAIPMAKMGLAVTAVEPSPGMADMLAVNAEAGGIGNLTIVRKKWEEVQPGDLAGPYDLVLASLSLGMPDIREALERMDQACTGSVCLIWPAGRTAWEQNYREAWPLIHGESFVPGSRADVLFNVLYQMGICPDVRVFREEYEEIFSSIADAVRYYRPMYCATDPEKELALSKFLSKKLDRGVGGLALRGVSTMALISWDVMANRMVV